MTRAHPDPLPGAALSAAAHRSIADRLVLAERTRVPTIAPSDEHDGMTVADAYAVQQLVVAEQLAAGRARVGRKVGLTSEAMQAQLGVAEPDFGVLTDAMVLPDRGTLDRASLIAPRLEAEFAFRLAAPLDGPDPTTQDVRAAIGAVALALEVIDSRVADWRIRLVDTVADNASSARVALGGELPEPPWDELPSRRISLLRDGEPVAGGPGSAVLGDPLNAVLWLARTLYGLGDPLQAGDIVLAGAVHAAVGLEPGHWSASSPGLPTIGLTVS